ncbi:magnesium transporter, partial [Desulfobulbus sp. US1]|nr:magnesium transporter [Desulfobulbus sp. US1]
MSAITPSWKILSELIAQEKSTELAKFLETLPSRDTARAVSRLTEKERIRLLTLLSPHDAADVIEYMP